MNEGDYSRVFYVSSHGMAGDHLFDWVPKALGAHPEIYIYLGESVRSKYLKERTRKERPNLIKYTHFLCDLGTKTYEAIGECFSYRAYQLELLNNNFNGQIRWVNLVRHPYAWLKFYVNWRANNLNMPIDNTMAIDHEWDVAYHNDFNKLDLLTYKKEDVYIWASYQGMTILNRMISDMNKGVVNIPIESLVESKDSFVKMVDYLTNNNVKYQSDLIEHIYSWLGKPFRKSSSIINNPVTLRSDWPDWKNQAYSIIVDQKTIDMFDAYGYEL